MNFALRHRGPDDSGVWIDGKNGIGLGHVRLSIIDLTSLGHQPMATPDGMVHMVYNGEVYNYLELRRELEALGHRFVSKSDSEVVLHAFRQWGTYAFGRFNGMFAAAFFDLHAEKLFLVRDRLGIKPLHFWAERGELVFSSEIKGIYASGRVKFAENLDRLNEFLYFGNTLGAATFCHGVTRILPGCFLEFDLRRRSTRLERYWTAPKESNDFTEGEAVERTRALLDAAVKRHLASDVPVGVFLSGGIDSSAIVALAARHYGGRLRTYTVGFDYVADAEERPAARAIADHFGTEHHELQVTSTDLLCTLRRLIDAHDAPFSDAANVPLLQLCEALHGETKVVLQGDGGDEVFGGYRRYEVLSHDRLFRIAATLASPLNARLPDGPGPQARTRFLNALRRSGAEQMALLLTVEDEANPPTRILSADVRDAALKWDAFQRYREVAASLQSRDAVQRMLHTDLQIILPDIFLEKVDRSTMAMSTEVRVPMLDAELVDFVAALPARFKVRWGQKKRLLRTALRGIVPDAILDRRKAGFGVPFSDWMRSGLSQTLLELGCGLNAPASSLFDESALRAAIVQHQRRERDNGFLLWKCLQLALWRESQRIRGWV